MALINTGCDVKPPMITSVCCNQCDMNQPPSAACINCHLEFGRTHCEKCLLWTKLDIHHCDKCGLCRIGKAEDIFHCDKCDACFSSSIQKEHECSNIPIKEQKCAICFADVHNSQRKISILQCGHGGIFVIRFDCLILSNPYSLFQC